jgi:hypothetical protein
MFCIAFWLVELRQTTAVRSLLSFSNNKCVGAFECPKAKQSMDTKFILEDLTQWSSKYWSASITGKHFSLSVVFIQALWFKTTFSVPGNGKFKSWFAVKI